MPKPVIELSSATLVSQYSRDRPNFMCQQHRLVGGMRHLQAISLPTGFLFIDLPKSNYYEAEALDIGVAAGVGRLLGGQLGAQLARCAVTSASASSPTTQIEKTFELATDEELREIVNQRRGSFVAMYDAFISATIDAPRMFAKSVGIIRFKARKVGKVELEVFSVPDMLAAMDVFQSRLGDLVQIRVAYSKRRKRFVKSS